MSFGLNNSDPDAVTFPPVAGFAGAIGGLGHVPAMHSLHSPGTLALNGGTCVLSAPATSWAAAEVGGIAALLFQRYAGESPRQIAARIVDTASGTSAEGPTTQADAGTSRYFGAGVVQPVDALTRPLVPAGGAFSSLRSMPDRTPPVRPPVEQADVLHHSRRVAIWAGLVGAGVVVVASILRPLLGRRSG